MAFSDINTVIASLALGAGGATPAPVLLIKHDRGPPVQGRKAQPVAVVVEVADVVHHPGAVTARRTRDSVSTDETITAYFRQEVLTAIVDPGGNDAWWIVVGGIYYVVENTQPWTAGGFWVVQGRRLRETSQMVRVYFGPLTTLESEAPAAQVLASLQSRFASFVPTRSFRFDIADEDDVVGLAYPLLAEQPQQQPLFTAINGAGDAVDVVPIRATLSGSFVVITMPKVVSPSGRLQYEVA